MMPEESFTNLSKSGQPNRTTDISTASDLRQRLPSIYQTELRGNTSTSLGLSGSLLQFEGRCLISSISSIPQPTTSSSTGQLQPQIIAPKDFPVSMPIAGCKVKAVRRLPFYCLAQETNGRVLDHSSSNIRFNKLCNKLSAIASNTKSPRNNSSVFPTENNLDIGEPDFLPNTAMDAGHHFLKKPTTVLYVKGIDPSQVTAKELANLFSYYGIVDLCIVHNSKCFALIKFSTVAGASLALQNLNRLKLCGNRLKLFYSKFVDIHEKRFANSKSFYQPPACYRRFGQEVQSRAHPVSRSLFIAIYSRQKSTMVPDSELLEIFDRISPCLRLTRYKHAGTLNAWHVDYSTQAAALTILMALHDTNTHYGNMQICFHSSSSHQQTTLHG